MSEHGGLHAGNTFSHHGNQGGNLVANALGLDSGQQHGHAVHGHHAQGAIQVTHNPSSSAGWNSALQGVKLSDVLQGINVTPNSLFVLLFMSMAGWLFVVYWIRHHEPLANSVMGTRVGQVSPADTRIINGSKIAIPFRSCAATGDIYCPGGPTAPPGSASAANSTAAALPLPAPPVPPHPPADPPPVPLAEPHAIGFTLPAPGTYNAAFGQPTAAKTAFMVPVSEPEGTRVKMIVNR